MQLTLIRHGTTSWNIETRYQGWTDVPLAEEGRADAERLKHRIASEQLDIVISSDLSRALETARIAFPSNHVRPNASLREISLGAWEGLTYAELLERDGEGYQRWLDDPFSHTPNGGESLPEFERRVHSAIDRIVAEGVREQHRHIAVVMHGGAIRAAVRNVTGNPASVAYKLHVGPCSITRVSYESVQSPVLVSEPS